MDDTPQTVPDEIARKHGDVRIALLRRIYGSEFALGIDGRSSLGESIGLLDPRSLEVLVHDYGTGFLFGPNA